MQHKYLIDGVEVDSQHPNLDVVLSLAYEDKVRPLCSCVSPPLPMYLAKFGDSVYIKRMPGTGAKHAPDCSSFEPPAELSGLGELTGSAIREDLASGMTSLKLDFALTKGAGRTPPAPSETEHGSVKAESSKMSIRALLHYLWDASKLTHWRAGWEGRRSWGWVHKQLTAALHNKETKGIDLVDCVYVPPPFSIEEKFDIAAARLAFMTRLQPGAGRARRLGIVVAEVKAIERSPFGHKFIFKQMPDFHFSINADTHKRVAKRFANELAMWVQRPDGHFICIASFSINGAGYPEIEEISLMYTNKNWIPLSGESEELLVTKLTEEGRHFIKGLRYNLPADAPLACAQLLDAQRPTALYIHSSSEVQADPPAASPEHPGTDYEAWHWSIGAPLGQLPAKCL